MVPLLRKTRRGMVTGALIGLRRTRLGKHGILGTLVLTVYFTHLSQQLIFFETCFLRCLLVGQSILVPLPHLFLDMATLPVVLFLLV